MSHIDTIAVALAVMMRKAHLIARQQPAADRG